jgi:hypothetical protein
MESNHDIIPRIGTFLILVGCGLMVLFVGSELSQEANFNYFFLSGAILFVGYLFRRRAQPRESGRFDVIRRTRERGQQRREQKQSKPQDKK